MSYHTPIATIAAALYAGTLIVRNWQTRLFKMKYVHSTGIPSSRGTWQFWFRLQALCVNSWQDETFAIESVANDKQKKTYENDIFPPCWTASVASENVDHLIVDEKKFFTVLATWQMTKG